MHSLANGFNINDLIEFDEMIAYGPNVKNFSHIGLWIPYEQLWVN